MAGWVPVSIWRPVPGAGQNLAISASSVASTAIDSGAQAIAVSAVGGNCHIALGTAPVATGTDMLVKASDPPLILRISLLEKIAVIQNSTDTGTLNVVPMTR